MEWNPSYLKEGWMMRFVIGDCVARYFHRSSCGSQYLRLLDDVRR